MHVSYGELIRTMPEAIRMLGFTYSQADDSAESVIWTECVLGQGYELLRDADRAVAVAPVEAVTVSREGRLTAVHLGSRPAFAFAARIADVAVAKAASDGESVIRVLGASGAAAVPFIAYRIARLGYGALVLWKPGTNLQVDDRHPMLVVSPPGGATIGIVAQCSFDASPPRPELPFACTRDVADVWYERAKESASNTEILVLAVRIVESGEGKHDDLFAKARRAFGPLDVINVAARLRKAIAEGLEVVSERHSTLTHLTRRIRIPSSKRSRAQAG